MYVEIVGNSKALQRNGRDYAIQRCGLSPDVSYCVAAQELSSADSLFVPYPLRNRRVAANVLAQAYLERLKPFKAHLVVGASTAI